MSKYIKLEDAIHNINLEVTGRKEYTGDMKANLFFALDDLPTIDIVRCEECKYAHMTYGGECKYCDKWSLEDSLYLDGDFFCSYGERKDNE